MRAHIIDSNGRVVNTLVVDELTDGMLDASLGGGIGDLWDAATGTFSKPQLTPEEIAADYVARLERLYDAKAQQRQYDNRFTCTLRAGYPGPFQAEGVAFAQWMDACNVIAYTKQAEALQTGVIPSWEDILAALPSLEWPA